MTKIENWSKIRFTMARTKSNIDRRALIIEGARELFGRYGFEKTTVDDIAKHTGIGKGSVYLEFKTKEDILIAIIAQFAEHLRGYLAESVESASSPYLDCLGEMIIGLSTRIYETATSNIHTPEALIHTHFKMREEFAHHYEYKKSRIRALVKKAAKSGEISATAPVDDITNTIELVTSCLLPPYIRKEGPSETPFPSKKQLTRDAKEVVSVLICGIKSKYSGKSK